MKTVIEPFRTKVVEAIRFTSREEREQLLKNAGFNLFNLKAEDVVVDLLTDSGTSAMSSEQWSALMRGDESYAGCSSFFRFQEAVRTIFGIDHVMPVHQGRAAERLFFGCTVKENHLIPSNTHFDTTRANIENRGAKAVDLPHTENFRSSSEFPFKGNIDLDAVQALISENGADSIPLGMITLTNNSGGGQPASLENIREYSQLLHSYNIPFYIDAARFAENAWLIKRRDLKYRNTPITDIVSETFSYADGCLMSAKKDGLSNMGGFIATNQNELAERIKEDLILTEGFPTYGGLTGRDLECIATGLKEALAEDYLLYREMSALYLARGLTDAGVPIVSPAGLHAIYLDARQFLPDVEPESFPGQALVCELYLEGGVRTCEIGTVMFGRTDPDTGRECPADADLVRLALPRRVYSQSHYDYVIEAVTNVYRRRHDLSGLKLTWQPRHLRHFTARFAPLDSHPFSSPAKDAVVRT
jgi:tyrosine phenol-lyase